MWGRSIFESNASLTTKEVANPTVPAGFGPGMGFQIFFPGGRWFLVDERVYVYLLISLFIS